MVQADRIAAGKKGRIYAEAAEYGIGHKGGAIKIRCCTQVQHGFIQSQEADLGFCCGTGN